MQRTTDINEHSSRSHLIVTVTAHVNSLKTGRQTLSRLHLVDLAGSENIKAVHMAGLSSTHTPSRCRRAAATG